MNTLILASNIAEASIWFLGSLILLLVQSNTNYKQHRPYQISKYLMAASFMISALSIVLALFFERYYSDQIEILNIYSLLRLFVISSMMLLSILNLYSINLVNRLTLIWLFGPTAVLLAINLILTLIKVAPNIFAIEELRLAIGNSLSAVLWLMILISIIFGITLVALNFMKARREHLKMINDFFSNELELRGTQWIDKSFIIIIIMMLLSVGSYFVSSQWLDLLYEATLTIVYIVIMARLVNYERDFMRILPAVEFANTQQSDSKVQLSEAVGLILDKWATRTDKPYMAPAISLADTSKMTGLSKRRLSTYINNRMGMCFNMWINSLRIKEVERMLADHRCDHSLSHIAQTAGFVDLAAMNNAFKRIVGATPIQYRQKRMNGETKNKQP